MDFRSDLWTNIVSKHGLKVSFKRTDTLPSKDLPKNSYPESSLNLSPYPSDVYKFLKKNANPHMALKLMQCCKYFQHKKFPYFVIKLLNVAPPERDSYLRINRGSMMICFAETNLNSVPDNLWITEKLVIQNQMNIALELLPKISCCDFENLYLHEQDLTLKEFKFISNSRKLDFIWLNKSKILEDDDFGSSISMETFFECLPNISEIRIFVHVPSINSPKYLMKVMPRKLNLFCIFNVLEEFNFVNFVEFLNDHFRPELLDNRLVFDVEFDSQVSEDYKLQLKNYIESYVKTWIEFGLHIHIIYSNMDYELSKIMRDCCNNSEDWQCDRIDRCEQCRCLGCWGTCMWGNRCESDEDIPRQQVYEEEEEQQYIGIDEFDIRKCQSKKQIKKKCLKKSKTDEKTESKTISSLQNKKKEKMEKSIKRKIWLKHDFGDRSF